MFRLSSIVLNEPIFNSIFSLKFLKDKLILKVYSYIKKIKYLKNS